MSLSSGVVWIRAVYQENRIPRDRSFFYCIGGGGGGIWGVWHKKMAFDGGLPRKCQSNIRAKSKQIKAKVEQSSEIKKWRQVVTDFGGGVIPREKKLRDVM